MTDEASVKEQTMPNADGLARFRGRVLRMNAHDPICRADSTITATPASETSSSIIQEYTGASSWEGITKRLGGLHVILSTFRLEVSEVL